MELVRRGLVQPEDLRLPAFPQTADNPTNIQSNEDVAGPIQSSEDAPMCGQLKEDNAIRGQSNEGKSVIIQSDECEVDNITASQKSQSSSLADLSTALRIQTVQSEGSSSSHDPPFVQSERTSSPFTPRTQRTYSMTSDEEQFSPPIHLPRLQDRRQTDG